MSSPNITAVTAPIDETRLLKPADICARLGISRCGLQTLVTTGGMPHYRVGRLLRFREADVLQWAASRQRGHQSAPEGQV